jgi:hypothetical protein
MCAAPAALGGGRPGLSLGGGGGGGRPGLSLGGGGGGGRPALNLGGGGGGGNELSAVMDAIFPPEGFRGMKVQNDFAQQYELGRQVGTGASCVVRLCRHRKYGTVHAVKVFSPKFAIANKRNLFQEVKILASLRHPNIIRLQAVFETDEELFLVMELASVEVFDLVAREGPLPEPIAKVRPAPPRPAAPRRATLRFCNLPPTPLPVLLIGDPVSARRRSHAASSTRWRTRTRAASSTAT